MKKTNGGAYAMLPRLSLQKYQDLDVFRTLSIVQIFNKL